MEFLTQPSCRAGRDPKPGQIAQSHHFDRWNPRMCPACPGLPFYHKELLSVALVWGLPVPILMFISPWPFSCLRTVWPHLLLWAVDGSNSLFAFFRINKPFPHTHPLSYMLVPNHLDILLQDHSSL